MSPKRKHYVRVFSNLYNVDLAIRLLNEGYTYKYIADKLQCHHTSVISFYERSVRDGVHFKKFSHRIGKDEEGYVPPPVIINVEPMEKNKPEKLNPGKEGYKEYLAEYNEKVKELQKAKMDHAREVIEALRKKQHEEGYVEDPYMGAWGGPI